MRWPPSPRPRPPLARSSSSLQPPGGTSNLPASPLSGAGLVGASRRMPMTNRPLQDLFLLLTRYFSLSLPSPSHDLFSLSHFAVDTRQPWSYSSFFLAMSSSRRIWPGMSSARPDLPCRDVPSPRHRQRTSSSFAPSPVTAKSSWCLLFVRRMA